VLLPLLEGVTGTAAEVEGVEADEVTEEVPAVTVEAAATATVEVVGNCIVVVVVVRAVVVAFFFATSALFFESTILLGSDVTICLFLE
jgi:hypothetical protein